MKVGICSPVTDAEIIKSAGYDYIEPSVRSIAELTDDEFSIVAKKLESINMKAICANGFFPSKGYLLTGPSAAKLDTLYAYTDKAMSRLKILGCTTAVLGEGRLRSFPQGFDTDIAEKQFADVVLCCADAARKHGITICVEPLRKAETNMIHTLSDAARIISLTGSSDIKITADIFHMYDASESYDEIIKYGDLIGHIHIAYPPTRVMPSADDRFDYASLGKALKQIGYRGCASFEWHKKDFESDLRQGSPIRDMLQNINI